MTDELPPWSWHAIADALAEGLTRASEAVELEQAVRGLDARSELELHPVLQTALREAGYGVHRSRGSRATGPSGGAPRGRAATSC